MYQQKPRTYTKTWYFNFNITITKAPAVILLTQRKRFIFKRRFWLSCGGER